MPSHPKQLQVIIYRDRLQQLPLLEEIIMNSEQSTQKRQKFRTQIRQKQINDRFIKIRQLYTNTVLPSPQSPTTTAVNANISPQLLQQLRKQLKHFITQMITQYAHSPQLHRNYQSIQKQIDKMYKIVTLYPNTISTCFDQELKECGSMVINKFTGEVKKKNMQEVAEFGQNDNDSVTIITMKQQEIQEEKAKQKAEYLNLVLVSKLMEMSKKMQYNKFSSDSAILICKLLWNVMQTGYHIPRSQKSSQQSQTSKSQAYSLSLSILTNLLQSYSLLLRNPNHINIFQQLKTLNFTKHLTKIIDISASLPIVIHKNMLNIIHSYLVMTAAQPIPDISLNGITILSTETEINQKFCVYAVYFLKHQRTQLYLLALQTINELFESNPYCIDSLKLNYFPYILRLINHTNREINVNALILLCTIVFYSQSASDQLVSDSQILDIIYDRLVMERDLQPIDRYSKQSLQKCTNIVCDLLLTKDKHVKKRIYQHHIWDLFFQSLNQSYRLFPTTVVFKFFFSTVPRKQRQRILPAYLQSVRNISLENDLNPTIKQLKQGLINVFYHSMEHESEQSHQQLVRLYEINGLLKIIDQFEIKQAKKQKEQQK